LREESNEREENLNKQKECGELTRNKIFWIQKKKKHEEATDYNPLH